MKEATRSYKLSVSKSGPKVRIEPSSEIYHEDQLKAIWKLHHKEDDDSDYQLYYMRGKY